MARPLRHHALGRLLLSGVLLAGGLRSGTATAAPGPAARPAPGVFYRSRLFPYSARYPAGWRPFHAPWGGDRVDMFLSPPVSAVGGPHGGRVRLPQAYSESIVVHSYTWSLHHFM